MQGKESTWVQSSAPFCCVLHIGCVFDRLITKHEDLLGDFVDSNNVKSVGAVSIIQSSMLWNEKER